MESTPGAQIVAGLRVVRGPNWKWGNQDASEGYVGTVIKWKERKMGRFSEMLAPSKTLLGVVSVIWDCGIKNDYRIGHEGAFDLRVVDNSATGVKHSYTSCIECCADSDITGIRWHCEECDLSICSQCFFRDKHDQNHTKFKRYETPNTPPVEVVIDSRKRNERIELKGIFQSARVKRGHHWKKGDEDIADGVTGVGWLMETRNQAPGMVQVKWQNGQTYPYRLGADGKVDLQLVKVASGGFYHPEHLPVLKSALLKSVTNLDGEIKFAIGDRVEIFVGEDDLKKLQDGHGGYVPKLNNFIGKPGIVRSLNEVGVIVVYEGGDFFNLNPEVLVRLSYFSNEQPVRIRDDEKTLTAMENKFGVQIARKQLAGETGRVVHSSYENIMVEVILDSDKNNERKLLHRDWVEILTGDKSVTKGMAKLKSKMISVLVKAASCGQHNTIKELLSKYPIDVDAKNDSGRTAFHAACRNGHLEIIKDLYFMAKEKRMTLLEQQDDDGRRAIHHAAEGCHSKILAFLIKPDDDPRIKGADLNAKDKKNLTALQIAVRAGCLQSVKLLIENGSDINSQDNDGDTALHNAIIIEKQIYRDPEIITALTSSDRINLKLRNKRGLNVLLLSVAVKNIIAFDHLLKVGGEELAAEDGTQNKFTALHLACYKGELQFVKNFLKHANETFSNKGKSLIEQPCKGGLNPLSVAVFQGHIAVVELLVEKGEANLKVADDDGDTPVHIAAIKLDSLKEEPNQKTSPVIFKIHSELKENHTDTLISYPGLSLMCYLISKGCPWRKTRTGRATAVINNELIRTVLETYGPSPEEPMDVEDTVCDDGCIFCSNRSSVFKTIEECGHVTNVACSQCFHSLLRKCPTCRRQLNSSCEQPNRLSSSIPESLFFDEEMSGNFFTPTSEYPKQYSNDNDSLNVAGQTGTVQQANYVDPGPSTSGYKAPQYYGGQHFQPQTHQQTYPPTYYESNGVFNQQQYQAPFYNQTSNLSKEQYHPGFSQPNNYQSVGNNFNIPNNNYGGQNNFAGYPPNMMVDSENWNMNTSQVVAIPEASTQRGPTGNLQMSNQPMTQVPSAYQPKDSDMLTSVIASSIDSPVRTLIYGLDNNPESSINSIAVPILNLNDQTEQQTTLTNENFVTLTTSTTSSKYIECKRIEEGSKGTNGPILIYDGNRYSVQRKGKGKSSQTTWQCIKAANEKRSKCPATIIEENNHMYRIGVPEHRHYLKPEGYNKKRRTGQQETAGSSGSSTLTHEP